MDQAAFNSLNLLVLWSGFALAFLFGAIAQATHFCTMGAISDVVNIGDWSRARQWMLAMAVAMIGFAALSLTGQIQADDALYVTPRWSWLSTSVGGLMFGAGMVLSSGCGNKTLIRVGTGNLKAWVVFVVMGFSAFATLRGITAVGRNATVDQVFLTTEPQATLGHWLAPILGLSPEQGPAWIGLVVGLLLALWVLRHADFWTGTNLWAGLGCGGIIVAMWWLTGHIGFVDEHPQTLEAVYVATNSGRMESLSFVAPMAYVLDWLMFYSDKSKVLTLGVMIALGVIAGSFVSALLMRTFRWEGFGSVEDLGNHLLGAVLMGVGGVTAMGCTIGQGLSGMSTLALNAFTALAFIVIGALLAMKYQIWRLERQV
ncbi:MAG: YeeE/YedE family protein [Alphaproteobacteria bacterium]|nr:YeeE/YedE family protein [Alphaproteobacteria bacterium]